MRLGEEMEEEMRKSGLDGLRDFAFHPQAREERTFCNLRYEVFTFGNSLVTQPIIYIIMSANVAGPSHPIPLAAPKLGRTPGKAHKTAKTATRRSHISDALKTPFAKRKEAETKREAMKAVEREMKEEEVAEKERCVCTPSQLDMLCLAQP
jgi:hypothetical protein